MAVNALPLVALLVLRASGVENVSPVLPFALFVVAIAIGQAAVIGSVRWAIATLTALAAAAIVLFVVLAFGDAAGFERLALVTAHIAGGMMFVGVQAAIGGRLQERWVRGCAEIWIIVAVLLAGVSSGGWHPSGNLSLFPGYRELSAIVVIFAGYGIASAFLLDHEENQRRTSALSTPR